MIFWIPVTLRRERWNEREDRLNVWHNLHYLSFFIYFHYNIILLSSYLIFFFLCFCLNARIWKSSWPIRNAGALANLRNAPPPRTPLPFSSTIKSWEDRLTVAAHSLTPGKFCHVSSLNPEPRSGASGSFSWLHSVLWACSLFPLDAKATHRGLLTRQRPYNHLQPWKQSASSNGKTNTEIFIHTQSFMSLKKVWLYFKYPCPFHDVKSFKLHTKKTQYLDFATTARKKKTLHYSASFSTHAQQLWCLDLTVKDSKESFFFLKMHFIHLIPK